MNLYYCPMYSPATKWYNLPVIAESIDQAFKCAKLVGGRNFIYSNPLTAEEFYAR